MQRTTDAMNNPGDPLKRITDVPVDDIFTAGYSIYCVFFFVYLLLTIYLSRDFTGGMANMFFGSLKPQPKAAGETNKGMIAIVIGSVLAIAFNLAAVNLLYYERDSFFYGNLLGVAWVLQSLVYALMIGTVLFLYNKKHGHAIITQLLAGCAKLGSVICLGLMVHVEGKHTDYRLVFGLEMVSTIWVVLYCTIYYALISGKRWQGMMGKDG